METLASLGVKFTKSGSLGGDHLEGYGGSEDLPLCGAPSLLREVLVDAIRIYCRAIALGGTWSPEYREAKRWLFDDSFRGLISFPTLCEIFAIDARELRRSLRRFPYEPDPRLLRLARLVEEDDARRSA